MAWEREILSLRVKCKRSERGCEWTGQLRYYKEHFVFCEHEDVTCDTCLGEIQRRLLHEHTTSQCPNRIVQCKYCDEEFAIYHTNCHEYIECTRFPVGCPHECGEEKIPREEVESHVRNDCVKAMVYCDFHEVGCTFYDERRYLEAHLAASVKEHLSKAWSKLSKFKELELDKEHMQRLLHSNNEELSELRLSEKKLQMENDGVRNDVKGLQKVVKGLQDDMVVLRRLYMENKDEIDSLKRLVQTTEEKDPENH